MQVRVELDFDGGSWPGPLFGAHAVAGASWVGPIGFLGLLETALGLKGPVDPVAVRAAGLISALRETPGFWSASLEADALGTARKVLAWRDLLRLHGWAGQSVAPRMGDLARIESACGRGLPDRLIEVHRELVAAPRVFEEVTLHAARSEWPQLWRHVFDSLEAHGTRVLEQSADAVPASGDLAGARKAGFAPVGDGSLQLLRAAGPMQAAEDVAEWIANLPSREGLVIVGGDTVLDCALRRHGLPTLGARQAPEDNTLLQLLPLLVAMGWWPADPERAIELLSLPKSPVPRGLAHQLSRALHAWPAVQSDAWNLALADSLAKLTEPEQAERLKKRLDALLSSPVKSDRYPVSELFARTRVLKAWLHGCLENLQGDGSAFLAASAQCSALEDLVTKSADAALSPAQLRRFIEEATREAGVTTLHPAQAGLAAVPEPGCLVGPAKRILWWSFSRSAAAAPARHGFTSREVEALAAAGVVLASAGALARAQSERWSRPLQLASEALVLVCPRVGEDGATLHPHPLWDELEARCAGGASLTRLISEAPRHATPPPREQKPFLPQIAPQPLWTLPAELVKRREKESPSSAASLIGCSLQWVLRYVAKLSGGEAATLPAGARLLGSTAHKILELLLKEGMPSSAEKIEARALELFDQEGPRLAAKLFLPGAAAELASARRSTGMAARALAQTLQAGSWSVKHVEEPFAGEALGTTLEGTPDLVLQRGSGELTETLVVDFKWDGLNAKLADLESGAAYQLGAYATLLAQKHTSVAYFILRQQRFLTVTPDLLPGTRAVSGPDAKEVWAAFCESHEAAWTRLATGEVRASAFAAEEGEVIPEANGVKDGKLVLEPPCRFCDYATVCGARAEAN